MYAPGEKYQLIRAVQNKFTFKICHVVIDSGVYHIHAALYPPLEHLHAHIMLNHIRSCINIISQRLYPRQAHRPIARSLRIQIPAQKHFPPATQIFEGFLLPALVKTISHQVNRGICICAHHLLRMFQKTHVFHSLPVFRFPASPRLFIQADASPVLHGHHSRLCLSIDMQLISCDKIFLIRKQSHLIAP